MRLETVRLAIVPIDLDHAAAAYGAMADPKMYAYIPEEPPENIDALRQKWLRYLSGPSEPDLEHWWNWTVWLSGSDTVIGTLQATVSLPERRVQIAYLFASGYWGQGFAAESVGALCSWLLAAGSVSAVTAEVDARNAASRRLLQRLGFRQIHLTRAADVFKGVISDEYLYRLDR